MSEVKWYARGTMGEWVLDQLECLEHESVEAVMRKLCRYLSQDEAQHEVSHWLNPEGV